MKHLFVGTTAKGAAVQIRSIATEDTPLLWEMINELSQEQTFIVYQGEQISFQEEVDYVDEQCKKIEKKKCVQLVVFSDGVLAGIASIDFLELAQRHIGEFGIMIKKPFRGLGIGTVLMEVLFAEAKRIHPELAIITLWVFSTNERALYVYKKAGFSEYGRLPKGVLLKNSSVDRVHMWKSISV